MFANKKEAQMNGKNYKTKGFSYCQLSREEVYEISKRRLEFDKAKLHSIVEGLPNSDISDIRWSGRLAEWMFRVFRLYCKFNMHPNRRGHKRTDV